MTKRRIVKQPSGVYTITIPKDIVESHGWQNTEFELHVIGNKIVLRKIEDEK